MTGHGGPREGSGRPTELTRLQRFMVGAWIEAHKTELLSERAKKLLAEHDNSDRMQAVEETRANIELWKDSISRARLKEWSEDIDDLFPEADSGGFLRRFRRFVSLKIDRPWGEHGRIIARARAWCREEYGVTITKKQADRYWENYKKARDEINAERQAIARRFQRRKASRQARLISGETQ
jgi:hypothetical protein